MKTVLVCLLAISLSFALPQAYTIRDAYHEIPLEYLPATKDYLKDKVDNYENRDKILIYHNEELECIRLHHSNNDLFGKLQLFTSGTNYYVAVEHTFCEAEKCQNEFVILKKEAGSFKNVSKDVLKDYDLNLGKLRGEVKKALKEAYGNDDFFEALNYKDDVSLRNHLIWEIDQQEHEIILKETSLPYKLAIYKWNEKKAIFVKI